MPALPPGFKVTKKVSLPPGFRVRKPKEKTEREKLDEQYAETVQSTPEEQAQFRALQPKRGAPTLPTSLTGGNLQFDELVGQQGPQGGLAEPVPDWVGQSGKQAARTVESIGQVYPVLDAAARMGTGLASDVAAKGTTLAGTAYGLASGQGIDKSLQTGTKAGQKVREATSFPPINQRTQDFGEAVAYPSTMLQKGTEKYLAGPLADAGYPNAAAVVASVPEAALTLMGGKAIVKSTAKSAATSLAKNAMETKKLVTDTMNKAILPKFKSKKTTSAVKKYDNAALTVVEDIVRRKNELQIPDEYGRLENKLPESVVDFQEAISQSKEAIHGEFTAAAEHATKKGYRVDTKEAADALDSIINNDVTANFTPAQVEYAIERQAMLERLSVDATLGTKPGGLTPMQAQEAIKSVNVSLQAYERSPSAANHNIAMVDAIIADKLRKALDDTISKVPDIDYQAAKNKYSTFKTIEDDVNKMANVQRNKPSGLVPDWADIIAGHQAVSALIAASPEAFAAAATVKGLSSVKKLMKDPNKRIKKMFQTVDKRLREQAIIKGKQVQRGAKND